MAGLRSLPFTAACALLALATGCSSKDSHPVNATDCESADCVSPGGGGPKPDGGTVTDAGDEAATDADAGDGLTVTGVVRETTDAQFISAVTYQSNANVRVVSYDATPKVVAQTLSASATGKFSLTIPAANASDAGPFEAWFGVSDNANDTAMLPTLQVLAVDPAAPTVYPFGTSLADFKSVYEGNPAASGQTFGVKANVGHVVAYLKKNNAPVAGVAVSDGAGADLVLYDQGSTYTATPAKTELDGIAILYDIPATAFPGTVKQLAFDAGVDGGAPFVAAVPVASGWVTRVVVQVP